MIKLIFENLLQEKTCSTLVLLYCDAEAHNFNCGWEETPNIANANGLFIVMAYIS